MPEIYKLSNGKYMGNCAELDPKDTDVYGYTNVAPVYDSFNNEMPKWTGTGWELITLAEHNELED